MPMLTVRNVSDEVHRALRLWATARHLSIEAAVREILASVVKPKERIRLGDALANLGREIGLTNEDFTVFDKMRDKKLAEPVRFE